MEPKDLMISLMIQLNHKILPLKEIPHVLLGHGKDLHGRPMDVASPKTI